MMRPVYIEAVRLQYGDQDRGSFLHHCLPDVFPVPDGPSAGELKALLPGVSLRRMSPIARIALRSACLALLAGGGDVPLGEGKAASTGLYIGSAFGDIGFALGYLNTIMTDGAHLASPTLFSHSVTNAFCGTLSMALNIQGPGCTVSQFGLSFAGALRAALDDLTLGAVDSALVGAVEQASPELERIHARAVEQGTSMPAVLPPQEDCAVFFLLGTQRPAGDPTAIDVTWSRSEAPPASIAARNGALLLQTARRHYEGHPAEQALDAALCAALLQKEGAALCAALLQNKDAALCAALTSNGRGAPPALACRHAEPLWKAGADIVLAAPAGPDFM